MRRLGGVPIDDGEGLVAAGHDLDQILGRAAAIFFKQTFRDGFFHGDQHPGNMFVGADGAIGAVDFGIMGRLDRRTRYYLADMLMAFLQRDYRRLADIHFDAGLVPARYSRDAFAQACRSVGEPIFGRALGDISFASLLGQLFRLGDSFGMEVQPQLLLLQKNMLMAEGVSRRLHPGLNIWTLAQPLIEDWVRDHRGPEARLGEAADALAHFVQRLPAGLAALESMAEALAAKEPGPERARSAPGRQVVAWVLAAALAAALIVLSV
jgi:ubiquinone biosynthesis protein